jgi:hypothetical protein
MPTKGLDVVRRNIKRTLSNVDAIKAPEAVAVALSVGGGFASLMVPMDTGTLVNSQFRDIKRDSRGVTGQFGYSAEYASGVHNSPGTFKGTGTPRDPHDPSRGDFWDPDGEPGFLTKGFEDNRSAIDAAVLRAMSL